jgi:ubiquinone biosynthesis protein COQ4
MALVKDGARIAQAIVRTMRDSTQTQEIHRVEEITGRPKFRHLLAEFQASPEGQRILAERPELSSQQVDYAALRELPATTLGGAYVQHLDRNGLSGDYQAAPTRYIDDPDMAYLMRRYRQTHDVWHALLGVGVTGHEEVIIHWFAFGQLRLPVSAMIMVLGGLKHLVFERRWGALRHSAMEAYRAGRDAAPLLAVIWEDRWTDDLDDVRADVGIRPLEQRWLAS